MEKKYTWHKIAESLEAMHFAESNIIEETIAGRKICLVLHNDEITACSQTCPHAGGKLSAGYVDAAGNIVCPLHRYKFNLKNGRNVSGEGYYLKTFPVEIRPAGVFVGFEENNFFNWLK
ncbi:MAG: Rieske 2Fe-2S domain-containing protein [Bacteroidota bacterium]